MKTYGKKFRNALRSAPAKIAAGFTATAAGIGTAIASPGAAMVTELTAGKSDVNSVIYVIAGIVVALLIWAYCKRAK